LRDTPLKEITVQGICKAAKITFYFHFDNIDDLMLIIDTEMQKGLTDLFRDTENGSFKPLNDENMELCCGSTIFMNMPSSIEFC